MSNAMPMSEKPSLSLPREEQPAAEWTQSALDPSDRDYFSDGKPPKPSQSTVSSPGFVAMPGGLPLSEQGPLELDVQHVKAVALDAAQSAAHSAQVAIQTVGEKVGDYLPWAASLTSYLLAPPPSEQVEGQSKNQDLEGPRTTSEETYHQAGVGTLPGPPGKIGVALLPDETLEESIESTPVTKTSSIMTTTNDNPITHHPEERCVENLPLHDDETAGRLGKSGGVGTLLGSANESGVALLPDDPKELEYKAPGDVLSILDGGASTDANIRTLPGSRQDTTDSRPHDIASSSKPQSVHSRKDKDASHTRAVEESPDSENPSTGVGPVPGGLTNSSGQSHPRKLGFMNKVKGEMKILSGKKSRRAKRGAK